MRFLRVDPSFVKWFYFGMHIKRWLLLLLVGVAIMGLGFGYFLREVYASYTFPSEVYYLTLQFLPRYVRGVIFVGLSVGLILLIVRCYRRSYALGATKVWSTSSTTIATCSADPRSSRSAAAPACRRCSVG